MSIGTSEHPVPRTEKPIFVLRQKFELTINQLWAEKLLDVLDHAREARVFIPPEIWAFYKQLENHVGAPEDDNGTD